MFFVFIVGLVQLRFKRIVDLVLSAILIVVASPLCGCLALAIRVRLGSPVIFRQARPGLNGVTFQLLKFRSMSEAVSDDGTLLPDADRLDGFGMWMRSSSLDELPSLWNVLKGEMSLVGPRPLLPEYLALYTKRQAKRHLMRPGITGWAQVNGRNELPWNEKLSMDVWYVENFSIALDLKILVLTALRVLGRRGITSPGHATAERFTGSGDG